MSTHDPKHKYEDPKKTYAHLPLVPEAVLKRRHDLDALKRRKALHLLRNPPPHKRFYSNEPHHSKQRIRVIKPETFIRRARTRRSHMTRYRRVMKNGMQKRASDKPVFATKEVVDPQDETKTTTVRYQSNSAGAKTCVFVIRIREFEGLPREYKKILDELKLFYQFDGVFVKYDAEMRKKLHLIEPWILYGPPSKAVVSDLITRRGHCKAPGDNDDDGEDFDDKNRPLNRTPLSDNVTVEKALGEEHGLICIEDLVHEIYNVGESFDVANNFLFPFKLTDRMTKHERKTLRIRDGKLYGDQGEAVDEYIQQML